LEPLESEERIRVVSAVLTLLGEDDLTKGAARGGGGSGTPVSSSQENTGNAQQYFSAKDPQNKIEELAVAARFREASQNLHEHKKEEIHAVFADARRNFDSHHFSRDMANAKRRGFFTKGGENKLAYYGQQYVDALPDREAVKAIRAPRTRKTASKKAGSKKVSK
jgi:hypothetical protein